MKNTIIQSMIAGFLEMVSDAVMKWSRLAWMPPGLRYASIALAGSACGIGLVFAVVLNAAAFVGDAPGACAVCHVMKSAYVTWEKGSHGRTANCNDCHIPQDSILKKYAYKNKSGMWDMMIFLTRQEPQVIKVTEGSKKVIRDNCMRCHERETQTMAIYNQADRSCADCHRQTPHGGERSLSSTPYARYPGILSLKSSEYK
jgi:cytochrome c nitrite reductase small subunit